MTTILSKTKVNYNEDTYYISLCNYGGAHYAIQINNVSLVQSWNKEVATLFYEMLKREVLQGASLEALISYYQSKPRRKPKD